MLRNYGIVGLLFLFLLTACQPSPTFLNSASPISKHESNLYQLILIMALIVFVLVEGALVWILVRDRRRKGDNTLPPQVHGNNALEITWTTIPILLTVFLFILTVRTTNAVAAPARLKSDLNLRVVGHRWWWEFDYPDLGIATANELHIPVGTTVQVSLESVDVIHSFWVPQLSGKTDVVPGQHNTMWLTADQPGIYLGQCAEFCGTQHALMRFKVFVDTKEDFDAWVANQQTKVYAPQTEEEQAGQKVVLGACIPCHSFDAAEFDTKKVGPNLTHLFSRTSFAGGAYELNEDSLRSWLQDTQKMKAGNDMNITISPREMDALMAYLTKLK
jgi:cytochrome c oxidase subunit 2